MTICRRLVLLLAAVLFMTGIALAQDAPPTAETDAAEIQASGMDREALNESPDGPHGFSYQHDPRDNPEAMRDIVVNPDAVYGFSPSPAEASTLKQYVDAIDWTDQKQVSDARQQRQEYHDSLEELYAMILDMSLADEDIESIARAVSKRRNELRLEVYRDDPEGLKRVKERNLEKYGDEFGPAADSLYAQYGSWENVLLKALGTNPGMDACLGFYDEYYYLYDLETAKEALPDLAE